MVYPDAGPYHLDTSLSRKAPETFTIRPVDLHHWCVIDDPDRVLVAYPQTYTMDPAPVHGTPRGYEPSSCAPAPRPPMAFTLTPWAYTL